MAMGAPVIATAHGGSLETVVDGETGWLVPPGDARALAATIRGALTNPGHLAAMKSKARAHVRARFTVDHCCAAETAAYRRLLARHTEG
jgi:glycosyltransferase involved in cell wall biosynthesis